MRKLATIRKITSVQPIKGKDRVEMATVDGWTCLVAKKDNFKEGNLCIFCEPDCVFPAMEQWEFLKKYNYRIRTQKYKDGDGNTIYSQGLVLPLEILKGKYNIGDDVTSALCITQYEPTMDKDTTIKQSKYPKFLMRFSWFRNIVLRDNSKEAFPSFVSKTDEERIQNCPEILESDTLWTATEKIDGQSGTFAIVKHKKLFRTTYEFYVCSRNYRIKHPNNSSYWEVAKKYDIKNKLIQYIKDKDVDWVAIQGECVAPNVQGNKYKVKEADLYVFNLRDFNTSRYPSVAAKKLVGNYGFKFVPIIGVGLNLKGKAVNDIIALSNDKSMIANCNREGIVFRSSKGNLSFKVVSPEFLIKHNE